MHGIQDHWTFRIGSSGRLFSTQYEQLGFKKGNDFWYKISVVYKKTTLFILPEQSPLLHAVC
jgi:hypothetical protein